MGGQHLHGHTGRVGRGAIRFAMWILIPTGIAGLVGMALLWPGERPVTGTEANTTEITGEVVGLSEHECPPLPDGADANHPDAPTRCGQVSVRLETGEIVITNLPSGANAPYVELGDAVVLLHLPDTMEGQYSYHIIDHDRSTSMWILGIAFALAVVAFGRWRGLLALVGLAVTFAVLLLFIVPAILAGESPLLVAIVGACVIMLAVLYLTHGFSTATTIAVLGTLASLVLTGLLSALAVAMTHLTGVADDDTSFLSTYHGVNMQGLLLAGILIGSLGALDDVTVTQAAAVTELAKANPAMRAGALYRAAARIGRSHIASVVNTIILAYAGASLPLLILIAAADRPLGQVLTIQLIAEEIVRSVVGTMGLIAAVPLTTLLAALTVRRFAPGDLSDDMPLPVTGPDDETGGETATPDEPPRPGPRPKRDRDAWLRMHDDQE
ncbi:putative membrane protein [Stackebrandtia albiflava]|uniref:Putative membrane protein n=1 Tax=Stackebrandtia albiflava TaxID=406432 RepID=A0A562UY38_9ACTN|nr:YibE/F family protein [Stackebrandtia albiflava]TWJ10516.1 putative membrane protein [Stackebrandtia albiflava]